MLILCQSTNNSDIIELIAESFTEILFWQMKNQKDFVYFDIWSLISKCQIFKVVDVYVGLMILRVGLEIKKSK